MEKEKLLEYLKDNTNILRTMVLEVNSYNGHLDYLDYYENDDYFFETFYDNRTIEAVRAVCYGDYNYTDDYVKINDYGNLDSCSEFEYEEELKSYAEEILDEFLELYKEHNVSIYDDELKENVDEYLEGE